MTDEELKIFIDKLIADNSKDEALFGIYEYGGGPDESFIKANKAGLQLFAAELLQGSIDSKGILADKEKNIIPLDDIEDWVEGDTIIDYIEPTLATRQKPEVKTENKFKLKLFKIGITTLLIFLLICVITGLGTIIKAFIN